jgi:opacity protein-like surface antigen
MYGQDNVKNPASGKSKLAGANADLAWDIGRGRGPLNFYLLGGVGAYNVKTDIAGSASTSATRFAWNGGAGTSYGLGRSRLFVEGRYVSISTSGSKTNLVPVTAGISFGGI